MGTHIVARNVSQLSWRSEIERNAYSADGPEVAAQIPAIHGHKRPISSSAVAGARLRDFMIRLASQAAFTLSAVALEPLLPQWRHDISDLMAALLKRNQRVSQIGEGQHMLVGLALGFPQAAVDHIDYKPDADIFPVACDQLAGCRMVEMVSAAVNNQSQRLAVWAEAVAFAVAGSQAKVIENLIGQFWIVFGVSLVDFLHITWMLRMEVTVANVAQTAETNVVDFLAVNSIGQSFLELNVVDQSAITGSACSSC